MLKIRPIFFAFILLFSLKSQAQETNFDRSGWSLKNEKSLNAEQANRQIVPQKYKVFGVDLLKLKSALASAPSENEVILNTAPAVQIELPNPSGGFTTYKVWDFAIFHPDLQAQFPDIHSFCGEAVDNPLEKVFMDISPKGFRAMILGSKEGAIFIDPYAKDDAENCVVYYKKDYYINAGDRMQCLFGDIKQVPAEIKAIPGAENTANCGIRREYRLALACTGEYATFHGGTTAGALAAMNTSMTRVNGIYQTEVSIKMILIANNSLIIYTNSSSDPYTNTNGSTMLGQNQTNIDNVIGSANYDIGHVFSTGGGGVAVLGSPCTSNKARGVTGSGSPTGDAFDVDYVAHEMGHQFGAEHTFASSSGSCSGNGTSSNAFEPGSGTTILAYAGICSPQNVQSNSNAYFHAGSLLDISTFVVSGSGNNCDTPTSTGNTKPSVTALTNITIPASIPFVLNGSATDPNANPLTYNWEQYNAASVSSPSASNTTGPLFRSLSSTTDSYRFFPAYTTVRSGATDTWELLPSVSRTLTFRLTARDNLTTGGCTDEQNMDVVVVNTGSTFAVTYPNGGETFTQGQTITATWNVAGTTGNGINTANVDILYTTNSFSATDYNILVANTPNDGTQSITLPSVNTGYFRIMVRANAGYTGTYYYDISNGDATIGTSSSYCYTINSTNVPVTIPTTVSTVTSNLSVTGSTSGSVADVKVSNLVGTHTYINDLIISLTSPQGTKRTLFSRICAAQNDFNVKFSDAAALTYANLPCPPVSGLEYQPNQTLAGFDGQNPVGTWQLEVQDVASSDGGSLTAWGVQICLSAALVLPIDLLFFDAKAMDKAVNLTWKTANEVENEGFSVERSAGNQFDFKEIDFVAAQRSGAYQLVDKNVVAGKTYYYRLAQRDFDGKTTNSPIRAVEFKKSASDLIIAPNPVDAWANLQVANVDLDASLQLQILDVAGKLILDKTINLADRQNFQALAPGVYQIVLRDNHTVWTGKMMKI